MSGMLERWTPFRNRQLDRFRNEIDDLFDRFISKADLASHLEPSANSPRLESFIEGDKLIVRIDLPGIDPEDVEVSALGNMLTVKGSREDTNEKKSRNFLRRETVYGGFERSLALPLGVKTDTIQATYEKGVLELTMPAPKELAAQKVPIQIETKG
jgi:HSP20 family protein